MAICRNKNKTKRSHGALAFSTYTLSHWIPHRSPSGSSRVSRSLSIIRLSSIAVDQDHTRRRSYPCVASSVLWLVLSTHWLVSWSSTGHLCVWFGAMSCWCVQWHPCDVIGQVGAELVEATAASWLSTSLSSFVPSHRVTGSSSFDSSGKKLSQAPECCSIERMGL